MTTDTATQRNVTTNQTKAIIALLTEPSRTAAAKTAGIRRQTLHKWLKQPHFREALYQAEGQAIADAARLLAHRTTDAAAALYAVIADPKASHYEKIAAAKVILESAVKLRSVLETEERLARIEELLGEQQY